MVQDIIAHGYVTGKAYMGITVTTVPGGDAQRFSMSQGALVKSVDEVPARPRRSLRRGISSPPSMAPRSSPPAELVEAKKGV